MVKKFVWGGANKKSVDIDYNHQRTIIVVKARLNYARLARALSVEGKNEKAIETLNFCMDALPLEKIPYDPYMPDIIQAYYAAGATDKALAMTNAFCDYYYKRLDYFLKQKPFIVGSAEFEIQTAIQYTSRVANACTTYGKPETGEQITRKLESYYTDYIKVLQPAGKRTE
jgi:tetratricopeptide (TPR) repeat protein